MAVSPATVWRLGSLCGLVGVGMGAFGAHGLQARYPNLPAKSIKNWELASNYLKIHGVALLGISLHPRFSRAKLPAPLMATGVTLFSGSIFALILLGQSGFRKVLGPVTPIGGFMLIAGWASMLF